MSGSATPPDPGKIIGGVHSEDTPRCEVDTFWTRGGHATSSDSGHTQLARGFGRSSFVPRTGFEPGWSSTENSG